MPLPDQHHRHRSGSRMRRHQAMAPLRAGVVATVAMLSTATASGQTAPPAVLPMLRAAPATEPTAKDSLQATTTQIGKGKQELRDVPQSVTVVTERLIDDRNLDTLKETLKHLEPRARQVMIAAYGLDEAEPCTLAPIGRRYGVSREAVRQWRNDALVLLRLPAVCGQLAQLCDQHDRQGNRRRQRLSHAWLRRRRGTRP